LDEEEDFEEIEIEISRVAKFMPHNQRNDSLFTLFWVLFFLILTKMMLLTPFQAPRRTIDEIEIPLNNNHYSHL
jgi:hypothetical protein